MSLAVDPTSHSRLGNARSTCSTCLTVPSLGVLSPLACIALFLDFIWEGSWVILNHSLILFVGFRMR